MGLEAPGERDDEEGVEREREPGLTQPRASLRLATTTSCSRKEEGKTEGGEGRKVGWMGEKISGTNDFPTMRTEIS